MNGILGRIKCPHCGKSILTIQGDIIAMPFFFNLFRKKHWVVCPHCNQKFKSNKEVMLFRKRE